MPGETPIKVLLVDDDEDDFLITRDLLTAGRTERYELDWTQDYDSSLAVIQGRQHDICLLDFRLGARTGLELLQQTRQLPSRLPIILLTGQGDHEVDLEAMKAGAADYLVKGQLTADTLERAIRYAIERNLTAERLRRDHDLIGRIMETSPVGILVANRKGRITFANQRAEGVLGLKRDPITRNTYNLLDWRATDPEGNPLPNDPQPLRQVLEAGRCVQDMRHAREGSDRRRLLLSTNAAPLFDASGGIDGMIVTVDDITGRMSLEAQLRHSQRMESIGQLASGVAHDINNILTVIQGHAGLVLNASPPETATAKSVKQILAASDRAARFVKQLLTFSRRHVVRCKVLDLNAVLKNLESMLARLLTEDINLEVLHAPDLPNIEADFGMMDQVIMNLVVNARDAMPKGGKLVIATAAVQTNADFLREHPLGYEGHFVCVTVSDTGCGMDRHLLEHIFEPFFTTKELGKGTGLGLATVYGIIKQHCGWVEVSSQPGHGSTFRVYLPAVTKPAEPLDDTTFRRREVQGGGETILLVEDEPELCELVRSILEGYHYRVLFAANGPEALQVWEQHGGNIDLLLTDVIMPEGMSGRELAAQLRQRKPGLKVIFTSGYSAGVVGDEPELHGAQFLQKPYRPPVLAELVRQSLDRGKVAALPVVKVQPSPSSFVSA